MLTVEMEFESLAEFEKVHSEAISPVTSEEWARFHDIFSDETKWTYWVLEDAG